MINGNAFEMETKAIAAEVFDSVSYTFSVIGFIRIMYRMLISLLTFCAAPLKKMRELEYIKIPTCDTCAKCDYTVLHIHLWVRDTAISKCRRYRLGSEFQSEFCITWIEIGE